MAKPYLTLKKWLSVDTELKKIFFEQEVENTSIKIKKLTNQNGKDHYFCTNDILAISVLEPISSQLFQCITPEIYQKLPSPHMVYMEQFSVETDLFHFNILKKDSDHLSTNTLIKKIIV